MSFYDGYLAAIEFTECHGDNPELRDAEFSEEFLEQCENDCEAFEETNAALLEEYCLARGVGWDYAGHDFWLTRNGHGTGFWDRGLGELGDKLTEAAKQFSQVDVYLGDDGLIYGS